MGKLPFMKFFPGDFDKDMAAHPLEIRGAWITIINHLWNVEPRGIASHDFVQWGRILGTIKNEAERIILYLRDEKIASCNVECNGNVTLTSRRIQREEKEREHTRLRVLKHRNTERNENGKFKRNGDVTDHVTQVKRQCNRLEVRSQKLEVRSYKQKELKEVLSEHIKTFSEAYPGINLDQETAKAQAWLESNPQNKKSNLKRYLNNWLNRAQENANRFPPKEDKFL